MPRNPNQIAFLIGLYICVTAKFFDSICLWQNGKLANIWRFRVMSQEDKWKHEVQTYSGAKHKMKRTHSTFADLHALLCNLFRYKTKIQLMKKKLYYVRRMVLTFDQPVRPQCSTCAKCMFFTYILKRVEHHETMLIVWKPEKGRAVLMWQRSRRSFDRRKQKRLGPLAQPRRCNSSRYCMQGMSLWVCVLKFDCLSTNTSCVHVHSVYI